jgi:hypothetical protein
MSLTKKKSRLQSIFDNKEMNPWGSSIPSLTKIRQIQSRSAPNNMKALGKLNQEEFEYYFTSRQ